MKVNAFWTAVVTAVALGLGAATATAANAATLSPATPRAGQYQPAWAQVPAATLPDRSQVQQQYIDRDGRVHVFFTVNEGLAVPPSLNVVSWQGGSWGAAAKLGPVPILDTTPTVASELSSGIPTVGWTNYETVWLARYQDGLWSTASAEVPGYVPSVPPATSPHAFSAVGTGLNGTTSGLLYKTGACSAGAGATGCDWTITWPASSSSSTVKPSARMPSGTRSYRTWVNEVGEVEALYTTSEESPVVKVYPIDIWSAKSRDGQWADRTLVATALNWSSPHLSLAAARSGDSLVAAWAQLDPQFGDTRQVASAQRNNGVWSSPEVLASGVDFAGLSVGGEDGPVCVRYGKYENYRFGSVQARTLTDGTWSVPASLSSLGSTSSTNAPCLFFARDGELPRATLLGVTQTSAFLTPEAPLGGWVTLSRGNAWTAKLTGTSLNAARLTFSEASPPSAPTAPRAQSLKGAVKFSWKSPANRGTGPLTYEYRVGAGSWVKTSRPTVTLKVKKGRTLTISVRAVNSSGPGGSITISGKAK